MNHLQKVFGMPETVDADFDLHLEPIKEDCVDADPKNPFNCVLVHTARRQFGSKAAIFFKTYCYVDLLDPKTSIRRVYRLKVTASALRHIVGLDTGKPFRPGDKIKLARIEHADKRTVRRQNAKAYRRTSEGKATGKLNAAKARLKKARGDLGNLEDRIERLTKTEKPASPKLKEARDQARLARTRIKSALDDITDAGKKVDAFRRASGKSRPRRNHVFDLTTRNGAAGHYNFPAAA
jgi:hypothetical protein